MIILDPIYEDTKLKKEKEEEEERETREKGRAGGSQSLAGVVLA